MIKSDLKLIFPHCDTGLVIGNGILFVSALMTIWCSFDIAGRSWVKLKKYQKSLREQNTKKFGRPKFYRRSGANSNRSWRHRYIIQGGQTMLCLFTELFSNLFSHPVYEVIPIKSLSLLVHQMQFLIKPIHSLSKSWKGTSRMKMRDTLSSLNVPKREIDQKYLNKSRK